MGVRVGVRRWRAERVRRRPRRGGTAGPDSDGSVAGADVRMTAVPAFDGVQLALLSNRLDGIVRKMANTLLRTGRSGVLNMARDFSCCIVTADHQLLTATESLPIHVLSGPDMMERSMVTCHPELTRGDACVTHSPHPACPPHPAQPSPGPERQHAG